MVFPQIKLTPTDKYSFYPNPDQLVATRFLEAVIHNPDTAWNYVSKVYSFAVNLDELREILTHAPKIKLSTALYLNANKNYYSIYIKNKLLHLALTKDNGAWKICGLEQEECKKF